MQSLAIFACVIAGSMAMHIEGYGTYGGYGGYPAVKEVAEIREEITEPAYGHNTYGYGHNNAYGHHNTYPAVKEIAEVREEITEPAYGHNNAYGYGSHNNAYGYGHNNAYGYGHNMLPMQVAKVQQITSFPSKSYY
jgi:hypothetical protein